jgi:hypothetical protein
MASQGKYTPVLDIELRDPAKNDDDSRDGQQPLISHDDTGDGFFARLHHLRRRFAGWRTGASAAAGFAIISFIVNLTVIIWLGASGRTSFEASTIYTGDCEVVARDNLWVHLAINVLSTVLLSGSNYCMQCLVAPTRAELDKAHARGKWLDVGVQSIRNLGSLQSRREYLWWSLALSSIPLHLM